jgi:hypothetical protein
MVVDPSPSDLLSSNPISIANTITRSTPAHFKILDSEILMGHIYKSSKLIFLILKKQSAFELNADCFQAEVYMKLIVNF